MDREDIIVVVVYCALGVIGFVGCYFIQTLSRDKRFSLQILFVVSTIIAVVLGLSAALLRATRYAGMFDDVTTPAAEGSSGQGRSQANSGVSTADQQVFGADVTKYSQQSENGRTSGTQSQGSRSTANSNVAGTSTSAAIATAATGGSGAGKDQS